MIIKNLNGDKLVTIKDKQIKIVESPLLNGTKYIVYYKNFTRLWYNKNRELLGYQIYLKNGCVFSSGEIIYYGVDKLYYSMNVIDGEGHEYDKLHIPASFIKEAIRVLAQPLKYVNYGNI